MAKAARTAKAAVKSKTKSKTGKARGTPSGDVTQIVLTFGPDGGIVKVEKVDKSGKHTKVSQKEFAEFFGEADDDDFEEALAEAYSTGVTDAIHNAW